MFFAARAGNEKGVFADGSTCSPDGRAIRPRRAVSRTVPGPGVDRAAWFGNDWVTLVLAVPLLLVALVRRQSAPHVGSYCRSACSATPCTTTRTYLFGATLNVFFALYVVALPLAVAVLILSLSRMDIAVVAANFRSSTPVRMIGGSWPLLESGGLRWLIMWGAYAFAGRPTPIEPRRSSWSPRSISPSWPRRSHSVECCSGDGMHGGTVTTAIGGTVSLSVLVALLVNSSVAIHRGLVEAPGELLVWGTLTALTTTATTLLLTNAGPNARDMRRRHQLSIEHNWLSRLCCAPVLRHQRLGSRALVPIWTRIRPRLLYFSARPATSRHVRETCILTATIQSEEVPRRNRKGRMVERR